MFRSMFTVGGLTLVSRVLGFVRDKLVANYLGAGAMADVWVAAFRLPNLFRRVFGEGAFNAAFVPMYGRRLEEGGEAVADDFARRTLSLMFVILATLFALCFIFMEPIMKATNVGFISDGRLEPAVLAGRITVVYLVFVCLMAAVNGVLNSRRVFGAPAVSYVLLNVVFIASLALFARFAEDPLFLLCWTLVVAGVCQLGYVVYSALRRGVDLRWKRPVVDDEMKRLGVLMAPGLVTAAVQQINLLVGQSVATLQEGGSALIYYADRINQLPLGVIGMAAGVVLLPEITRNLRGGDPAAAKRSLSNGMELSLFLSLPAMAAMLVIPRQIMFIMEGGQFQAEAVEEAGRILAAFALATPAYILVRVLQPAYFAQENTKTPMRFTVASALLNAALVYPMFLWLGPTGCALATSIAGWVNVLLLWSGLKRIDFIRLTRGFVGRVSRIALASAAMGGTLWGLAIVAEPWLAAEGRFFSRLTVLGLLCSGGLALYVAAVLGLRVYSIDELKKFFRRNAKA